MNEESAELLDSELLKDAEATAQRPALADAPDELQTVTRLPAITPPPPAPVAGVLATQPLPVSVPPQLPPQSRVPQFPPQGQGPQQARAYPSAPPAAPKPSWLNALLTTTLPPPATAANPASARLARQRAGIACVAVALVFALVAMITGLRGAPDDASLHPVIAAAIILAHALIAVGAGAFSFGLLRMAERLLDDR